MTREPYSYRSDRDVPEFDDSRPLFVFDNVCVLCSGGVSFLMRRKRAEHFHFTSAQGALGQALYRHCGLEMDDSYLFIADGRASTLSDGYFEVAKQMGGPWMLSMVFRLIPRPLRDAAYRMIARNRYRWFGKTAQACALLTEEQRRRLV